MLRTFRLGFVLLALAGWWLRAAAAGTTFDWRIERFANEFWILDQVAAWDGDEENAYRTTFAARFGLTSARKALLARYAAIRRARAAVPESPGAGVAVSMIPPPPEPAERFALAFVTSPDERTAATKLRLDASERAAVEAAFAAFRNDLDTLIGEADGLEKARGWLRRTEGTSRLGDFVEQMKTFYAAKDDAPYVVHLLWAPPGFGRATVWDHDVVLPLTQRATADEKELASWLGVLVHECGHQLLAARSDAERAALSQRIVATGGVLNQRHANVIDEATQTALGNIVFMRDRLPFAFDDTSFYSYEPRNDVPDAIDSLARVLEPLVRVALAEQRPFSGKYLDDALTMQLRLFGDAPRHHARVALVVTGTRAVRGLFTGLFWGKSRTPYDVSALDQLVRDSRAEPAAARWAILTSREATPEVMDKLEMPVAKEVTLGANAACARARRRGPGADYDFFVLGRDTDGLRRMLVALQRASTVPVAQSLCLPIDAR